MYKNYFKINVADKERLKDILPDTSWQEKDILGKLMTDYIPSRLHQIIPIGDYYECIWDNIDSFFDVTNTIEYVQILYKLKEYSTTVEWVESLPG